MNYYHCLCYSDAYYNYRELSFQRKNGKMDEDEIRKNIQDCAIPGNYDPAGVERLSLYENGVNTAESKFRGVGDNDDSGLTETPR